MSEGIEDTDDTRSHRLPGAQRLVGSLDRSSRESLNTGRHEEAPVRCPCGPLAAHHDSPCMRCFCLPKANNKTTGTSDSFVRRLQD